MKFICRSGDWHYSKNKVIEFVPDKKVVWHYEWTGTKMIFELTSKGNNTLLK